MSNYISRVNHKNRMEKKKNLKMIVTLNNTIYMNLKLHFSFSLRQDPVKIIYKL